MYDFYFGDRDAIFKDELGFLTSVKRMLPRWCNSIPDSEVEGMFFDLSRSPIVDPNSSGVIIETGCGASTIVLTYLAFKHQKRVYTWDTNQNKLAYIRSVLVDTLQRLFDAPLHRHWVYIPFFSTSQELGIPVLAEFKHTVDFAFYDSEHTADVLLEEVRLSLPFFSDNAIVALDDANYKYRHKNISYINVFRKKLGLPAVPSPPGNEGAPFFEIVQELLKEEFPRLEKLEDRYKEVYKSDLFWSYYSSDRSIMNELGMEKMAELEHRYDSFRIVK